MTPEEHQRLQDAANRLTAYLNDAPGRVEHYINSPQPGSPLATEGPNESWFTPVSLAVAYLVGANEHLVLTYQGLAVTDRLAALALVTVLRGALEGSVRAMWLLDADLTVRERVARGLLERCANIDSGQRVRADTAHLATRDANIRAVAEAHELRLEGHLDHSPLPRRIGGEIRPSMTKLSDDALRALNISHPEKDPARERNERWFFAWLSAVAHSAGWALISEYSPEPGGGGYRKAQISGDAVNLAGAIDVVIQVHSLAVQRLATLSLSKG